MYFILQESSSYDHVTNKTWEDISLVITENFDEANMISDNSELKKFIKKYLLGSKYKERLFVREWLEHFVSRPRQMEIFGVYGSAMEGGIFSVLNFNSSGDYNLDFDLMVGFGLHKQQKVAFRYVPDNPVHLIIEITRLKKWGIKTNGNKLVLPSGGPGGKYTKY